MPFGEYELSPSLIGLSLLHTPHREAFQRLSVRPSIPRYRDFSLDMCRSLGFASATTYSKKRPVQPRLHSGSRPSWGLTSHVTATRRFIMQKARRHRTKAGSDRLEAHGFRYSFTPLAGVLFTFPSRYWFAIGLTGVFSLAGWTPRIQAGLLVSRPTQDATRPRLCSCTGLSPSMMQLSRCFHSTFKYHDVVLQPQICIATQLVWASPRSLAATGGITLVFFSSGY